MIVADPLPQETRRLESLQSYAILDTPFEKDYDDLCRLAATICGVPMALISFVDQERTWYKAMVGVDVREGPRDLAFCSHAIWQDGVFEISDATLDERFFDNPLVTGGPSIRFYAGQPLVAADGQPLGTLCALDRVPRVLDERQKEALAILARQVVTQLELRKAAQDLVKLNQDKDQFFSIIGHDLRSPFSGLLGLVDLLHRHKADLQDDEVDKYIGLLHQGVHNVYNLSENLLKWALVEQGKMAFHPEVLTATALVDEVDAALGEAAGRKAVTLEVSAPEGLEVPGDRNMVETALRNLVANAVKFSPRGGRVVLGVEVRSGEVRFNVSDSGMGMDATQLEALRAGRRTPSRAGTGGEPGTGLGLTLARQFAQKHGGRLEFTSEEGQGTTATLVLPLR